MFRTPARALVGLLAAGLLASPLLLSAASEGTSTPPPERRASTAPNVMFPIAGGKAVDLHNSGRHPGTELAAACGSVVRAATPGFALVSSSPTSGPHLVRIVTSYGHLVTWYGYMQKSLVSNKMVIQAGQPIGIVGHAGIAKRCALYFAVTGNSGKLTYNPSRWLNTYVGRPMAGTSLFGNNGFVLASFNTLGASHTTATSGSRYPTYAWRTPRQLTYLNSLKVDVVGLQEFQLKQQQLFLADANGTFGYFPSAPKADTENSIIWRRSTMQYMQGTTLAVPYFDGHIRQMPVILLRQRSTGREAWFINVHNPASISPYGNQSAWRAKAIAVERAKIIELRQTGLPVFLTGDLNDGAPAYCPLSKGMLLISANAEPSMTCSMPSKFRIDWVLAAGPARFTRWDMPWTPKDMKLTDHPIVLTHVNLAPKGW